MNTQLTDTYRSKAQTTRQRRQAAGRYDRPTKAQAEAFKRTMARGGYTNMTPGDMLLLSTHPWLLPEQRAEYAKRYAAATQAQ